jgi:acyl CoA:acetate/3-ketoacid CoA transferase alpha subunit
MTVMNSNLEMLMAREQLIEDIERIVEVIDYADDKDILVRILCDAVCRNFPTR